MKSEGNMGLTPGSFTFSSLRPEWAQIWEFVFSAVAIMIAQLVFGLDECARSINRKRNGTGLGMLSSPEKQTLRSLSLSPSTPLSFCLSMGDGAGEGG